MKKGVNPQNAVLIVGDPKWASCRTISKNLQSSYARALSKFVRIEISLKNWNSDSRGYQNAVDDLCARIASARPSRITFVDYLPHPAVLLFEILTNPSTRNLDFDIDIHVYGDFVPNADSWFKIEPLLKGRRVRFRCPSRRASAFVAQFVKSGARRVRQCPYPIDPSEFHFAATERLSERRRLGLAPNDRLIVFAGRISLQKNVDLLIREFARLISPKSGAIYLFLAGEFDDVGAEMLGYPTLLGWNFNKLSRILDGLSPDVRSRIRLLGAQNRKQLRNLFAAADLFWSLSLFHDEDFGMAVGEALACGLPCVLTDWGGYSSFRLRSIPVDLVEVKFRKRGLVIDLVEFRRKSLNILNEKTSDARRMWRSKMFLSRFSIDAKAAEFQELESEMRPRFVGFTPRFSKVCSDKSQPLLTSSSGLYKIVYRSYWGQQRRSGH